MSSKKDNEGAIRSGSLLSWLSVYRLHLIALTIAVGFAGITMVSSRLIILTYILSLLGSVVSQTEYKVNTGYATYVGNLTRPNVVTYLGIPYAEPPVGELRFRAPLPLNTTRVAEAAKGSDVDAKSYPDFCIQGTTGGGDAGGAGSEDCLKVNIYAPPRKMAGVLLPVLVYIHGGGYIYGNPRNWPFDHWVEQDTNVVIVSVYYRLSSFGFLSHPDFLSNPTLADLNAGLRDQIEALRWVNKYIWAFGGDSNKVTINGQSAGGASVMLHMVMNRDEPAGGLFKAAIAQSVYRTPMPTPQQQVPLFEEYSRIAGCGNGTLGEKLSCLRSASVSSLAKAQDANKNFPYASFHPVMDGVLVPDFPSRLFNKGLFRKVPIIVGATSNETLASGPDSAAALRRYFPSLTGEDVQEIEKLYSQQVFVSAESRQLEVTGDHSARCGREIIAGAVTKANLTAFAYRYATPLPGYDIAWHSVDNWLMFLGTSTGFNGTTTFNALSPTETAFASEIIAYWLSFVKHGDPNVSKLARSPIWPAYSTQGRLVLDKHPRSADQSGVQKEKQPEDTVVRCNHAVALVDREQN